MERDVLLAILERCTYMDDAVEAHVTADSAVLEYLNDPEILMAFDRVPKHYGA